MNSSEHVAQSALQAKQSVEMIFDKIKETNTNAYEVEKLTSKMGDMTRVNYKNIGHLVSKIGEVSTATTATKSAFEELTKCTEEIAEALNHNVVNAIDKNAEAFLETIDNTVKTVNENILLLTQAQEDFNLMTHLQEQTIEKIHYSDQLIKQLAEQINSVQIVIDNNLTDCEGINKGIQTTTATIQELNATFEQIAVFADSVNSNAKALLEEQAHKTE